MKVEAQQNDLRLTLETRDVATHALVTDHRPLVEAALRRAARWFQEEVDRLRADPLAEFRPEGER